RSAEKGPRHLRPGALAADEEHYAEDGPEKSDRATDELRPTLSGASGVADGAAGSTTDRRALHHRCAAGRAETAAGRILTSTGGTAHVGLQVSGGRPLGVQDPVAFVTVLRPR